MRVEWESCGESARFRSFAKAAAAMLIGVLDSRDAFDACCDGFVRYQEEYN